MLSAVSIVGKQAFIIMLPVQAEQGGSDGGAVSRRAAGRPSPWVLYVVSKVGKETRHFFLMPTEAEHGGNDGDMEQALKVSQKNFDAGTPQPTLHSERCRHTAHDHRYRYRYRHTAL